MNRRVPEGFTLLEMLTAIGVLSLMMVFMFNIVGQTVRSWESGSRRMESAQAARIGMNLLASELRYAFAGVVTNNGTDGTSSFTNVVPFVAVTDLPGEKAALSPLPGSQSLFFVSTSAPHDNGDAAFAEVGYMPVFVSDTNGVYDMAGSRYYLVRHGSSAGSDSTTLKARYQDFYYRNTSELTSWTENKATVGNRTPIVDNCIRMTLQFASNNAGSVSWSSNWPSQTNLPLGVLVTILVLDSKSAARLEQIQGAKLLAGSDIDSATNNDGGATNPVARILREGTTVMRRFVPLANSYYSP